MQKVGRNDPCPCGSGKKFKKCCESKMMRGKFLAQKIDNPDTALPKINTLKSLFHKKVPPPNPPKTLEGKQSQDTTDQQTSPKTSQDPQKNTK